MESRLRDAVALFAAVTSAADLIITAGTWPDSIARVLSCVATATRQDPCVLDTFLAVVDFMNGHPPRAWWEFTPERKKRFPDV